jgi:hypothetical protein
MYVAAPGWCEGVKVRVSAPLHLNKREGLDVGILRIGACPASMQVNSKDDEVVR